MWHLQVELNQPDGVDVYDFLHLVSSSSNGEELDTACIGAEIDNLDLDDESMGIDVSPLRDSEKPTFEDGMEIDDNQIESGWEKDSSRTAKSNVGWDQAIDKAPNGGWDQAIDKAHSGGWDQAIDKVPGGGWDQVDKAQNAGDGPKGPSGVWDQAIDKAPNGGWDQAAQNASDGPKASDSAWAGWGKAEVSQERGFSKNSEESPGASDWSAEDRQSSWKQSGSSSGWGKKVVSERDSPLNANSSGSWDLTADRTSDIGASKGSSYSAWSSGAYTEVGKEGGFSKRIQEESPSFSEWGTKEPQSSWKQSGSSSGWVQKVDTQRDSSSNAKSSGTWDEADERVDNVWAKETPKNSGWSKWGSDAVNKNDNLPERAGEDSSNSAADVAITETEEEKNSTVMKSRDVSRDLQLQWGARKRFNDKGDSNESPRGWGTSSNADWKNKRNRPPKPAENSGGTGLFTKTRQRLDLFTAEEQDILADIEPIMENIRRIMNQTG